MDGYVFVSYRHGADSPYVDSLVAFLQAAGVPAWHDHEVVIGDRWEHVIRTKIEECSAFIVVMTPEADKSDWVKREITHAEAQPGLTIFPLLLKGKGFFRLSNLQAEDVRDGGMPAPQSVERLRHLVQQRERQASPVDDRRDIVVTIARRSQSIVQALVKLLEAMESGEPNESRRAQLAEMTFRADVLRRIDERLLVLADDEPTHRVGREPAQLHEILNDLVRRRRYGTVAFPHLERHLEIADHVAYDLCTVVDELLDNSVSFSPPDSTITVEARRRKAGAEIRVRDEGIGIKPEHLAELNERLSAPPRLTIEVLRQTGLAVVARLADRHGLHVRLDSKGVGTVAEILIPETAVVSRPGQDARRARRPRSPSDAPEIPALVVRAGIAALPRDRAQAVLEGLSPDQVRRILAGMAAERAQAVLDNGRSADWPFPVPPPTTVRRPALLPTATDDAPELS